jgi:hypothetical protein
MDMLMPQVAVKISEASFTRLKRLAQQGGVSYASVIESALTAYHPATSATSETASLIPDVQALLDQALAPVIARLAALEAGWAGTAPEAPHGPQYGEPESEPPLDAEAPEIAAQNDLSAAPMENDNEPSSSIPSQAPRAFAELSKEEKQQWGELMLSWQGSGMSNAKIGKRLWDEQKIGQWSFGKLAPMDRNRVKVEIDRIKRG